MFWRLRLWRGPRTDPTRARLAARTALPASGGGLGVLEVGGFCLSALLELLCVLESLVGANGLLLLFRLGGEDFHVA